MTKKKYIVLSTLSGLFLLLCASPLVRAETATQTRTTTVMKGCICTCPAPDSTEIPDSENPSNGQDDPTDATPENENPEAPSNGQDDPTDATPENENTYGTDQPASPNDSPASEEPTEPVSVYLNEVLPNPSGRDTEGEFIELINAGSTPVDLSGWSLRIGQRDFRLEAVELAARETKFWLYSATKLTLTNSGATIELLNSDGQATDAVSYGGPAPDGQSYARDAQGVWHWSLEPTPGQTNRFPAPPSEEPETASDPAPESAGPSEPSTDDVPTAETETEENSSQTEPEDTASATTAQEPDLTANLVINEFLPDPEGSDSQEWIELWNRDSRAIRLDGWQLDDSEGGSSEFILTGELAQNAYLTLNKPKTGIALNNGGDSVRLIAPDGRLVESVSYETAPTGQSFARGGPEWFWTDQISPGQANPDSLANISENIENSDFGGTDDEPESAKTDEFAETEAVVPLTELPDQDENALILTEGVVSLSFGVLGKTIFMIQDTPGQAGAEIRVTSRTLPTLKAGDRVRLTGRMKRLSDGWRLNARTDHIQNIGSTEAINPLVVPLESLDQSANGVIISTEGLIASRTSKRLRLTDESGIPELDVLMADGGTPPGEIGQKLAVTGLAHWERDQVEILALDEGALKLTTIEAGDSAEKEGKLADSAQKIIAVAAAKKSGGSGPPTWTIILSLAAVAGLGTWTIFSRRRAAASTQD